MKQLNHAIIGLTAISLLTLVGCSTAQQSSTPSSPKAEAPTSSTTSNSKSVDGFGALSKVVAQTKTAVEAGNFPQAEQDFSKFETAWQPVEDGVKAKSSKSYNSIEDAATQVKGSLKSKNKAKAIEELKTLEKTIANISKP